MLSLRLDESFALAHLLRGEDAESTKRRRGGLIVSAVLHLILVPSLGLMKLEAPKFRSAPDIIVRRQQVTPLVAPRLEQLTQRAPNKGVVSEEVNLESLLPRPEIDQAPGNRPQPRQMAALPPMGATIGDQQPDLIEPPKIDAPLSPVTESPLAALGTPGVRPPVDPPAPAPQDKPQIQFEKPGSSIGLQSGTSPITAPNTSVAEAMRLASRGQGSGGNQVASDFSVPGPIGGASSRGTPSRGSVELLSDPDGVDFRPYLIQVLAAVKRNWFAVMPQSARYGRRGQVQIQFAVARDGRVPKLVIASSSGADPLDRAAVAGVSASNPFPPLPADFKGNEVRLQFTFSYNIQ